MSALRAIDGGGDAFADLGPEDPYAALGPTVRPRYDVLRDAREVHDLAAMALSFLTKPGEDVGKAEGYLDRIRALLGPVKAPTP